MGLPKEALEFLSKYEDTLVCPCCHRLFTKEHEVIGHYEGMLGDIYDLHRYNLKSGLSADEFLQADPWSSGPCFFIGLRVSDGLEFRWSKQDIQNA
jgi:hypothetical protein